TKYQHYLLGALAYLKVLARNAIPASPARFMYRFSCSCMSSSKPRQFWGGGGRQLHFFACKIMHPVHARSKREARQRKSRERRGGEVIKNPHREGGGWGGINARSGGFRIG
ncbi:TPA: hypothetical protein ACQVHL_003302, partial [Serratia marcescens]